MSPLYIKGNKKCWICKKSKSRKEFHKDSAQYDGFTTRCKKCEKSYRKKDKIKYDVQRQHNIRKEIIELLGNKCVKCGIYDFRVLQIDHIDGGGNKERKKYSKAGRTYYPFVLEKIKKGSKEYQILCANCNWIKRYENREDYNQ